MLNICLVEDEESLSEMIQLNLELEGYNVTLFNNGQLANNNLSQDFNYNLVILDVMLPGVNGIEICKTIRKHSQVPVLFLSAKGTTSDRIEGLKAGGNDYLPKPFDLEELLLRVKILIGEDRDTDNNSIKIGDFTVDFKSYQVTHNNSPETHKLSKKEVALIQLFDKKEGEVISRNEILDEVWGKDQFPTTRTIDNYILNFRKIFEVDPKHPVFFHSIRGVGYKFLKK